MWYSTLPSTSRGSISTQYAKEGTSEQARRVVVRWNRAKRQHQREDEMILVRGITYRCPGYRDMPGADQTPDFLQLERHAGDV